jgi:hypothetical protein
MKAVGTRAASNWMAVSTDVVMAGLDPAISVEWR